MGNASDAPPPRPRRRATATHASEVEADRTLSRLGLHRRELTAERVQLGQRDAAGVDGRGTAEPVECLEATEAADLDVGETTTRTHDRRMQRRDRFVGRDADDDLQ